ncbi:MAG: hypothetical protein GY855_15535 [candidate division Zixibacteria bacterium]|nr:hypothetical protein [candidate division Zixibacteria bacterium]
MMIPPLFFRIRVMEDGRRKFALWLPLFLLWPFALCIVIILIPFYMIASLALIWTDVGIKILKAPVIFYELLCAMRGLHVNVNDKDNVLIDIK